MTDFDNFVTHGIPGDSDSNSDSDSDSDSDISSNKLNQDEFIFQHPMLAYIHLK